MSYLFQEHQDNELVADQSMLSSKQSKQVKVDMLGSVQKKKVYRAHQFFNSPKSQVQQALNYFALSINERLDNVRVLREQQSACLELPADQALAEIPRIQACEVKERMSLTEVRDALARVFNGSFLEPFEIYVLQKYDKICSLTIKEIGILLLELSYFSAKNPCDICPIALVYLSQPHSSSLLKGTTWEFKLKLLCPTHCVISKINPVAAEVLNVYPSKNTGKDIILSTEHDFADFAKNNVIRVFCKFSKGTSKRPISIRFCSRIRCSMLRNYFDSDRTHEFAVYSELSVPYTIITNTIQWKDSEKFLVKLDLFGDSTATPFYRFANIFQDFYSRTTRQALEHISRPLTVRDLEYIQRFRFSSFASVTSTQFDGFWDWFGPISEKIRHQKNFIPMWLKGFIFGFISKEECEEILRRDDVWREGAFIIRFSDHVSDIVRNQGKCTAAFVANGKIWHFVLDDTDLAGNKRTVVDVLYETAFLRHCVQITQENNSLVYNVVPKDSVIRVFRTTKEETFPGYTKLSTIMMNLSGITMIQADKEPNQSDQKKASETQEDHQELSEPIQTEQCANGELFPTEQSKLLIQKKQQQLLLQHLSSIELKEDNHEKRKSDNSAEDSKRMKLEEGVLV